VDSESEQSDIVWNVPEIARLIHRTERQTYHLLEQGHIKSARKVGQQWQATRSGLRQEFGGAR
jgi:hypothetical protein